MPGGSIIIDADSFAAELAEGPVLFIGDGALKCREAIQSPNASFAEAFPTAMAMAPLAEAAYQEKGSKTWRTSNRSI